MIDDRIRDEITNKISSKKPYKVILFGSSAHGTPHKNSDIDLLVVLDKEGIPKSYHEKSLNYLEISRLLRGINKNVPMDIIVLTKTQWEKFIELKSGFSKEILATGIELI